MAIGDDYLSVSQLKTYMSFTDSTKDELVGDAISSASREIERHCNRQFNSSAAATTRRYHAGNERAVTVDDFWTEDDFVLEINPSGDGSTWETVDASEYELSPLDGMSDGVPWVYYRITLVGDSVRFPCARRATVRVTAKWGWENVPADVLQAVRILAADTYQLKDSRMGVAGSDQFGTIVRVKDSTVVAGKLKNFVRRKVMVA